ncbi:MAG: hypothetical protein JWM95_101 [Gemmatimonadetes bacterium]|nr:hypothetical protein [Gemmatimonadota bacterium]
MFKSLSRLVVALLAGATLTPRIAHAQLPIPSLSVVGGVSSYDLSGTGTTPFGALRLEVPLIFLIAEGSLGVMRPSEGSGTHTYIIPEVQAQWQLLPFLVKPYIGVGGGLFRAISGPGTHANTITGSASAGVRVGVPLIGAGFRAEARVRGIGSGFGGSAVEYTAGVSW